MSTPVSGFWPRRRLLRLLPALALAGCVQLPGQGQAPRRFRLKPATGLPADLPSADWALEIDQTAADPGIDTTRIAQLGGNGIELQYFADAEWPGNAADMVNTLLIQSFVDSGRIPRVGDRSSGLRPDYVLKTVLRDFQAEAGPAPAVTVAMTASLVQMPRRIQAGAERFQARVPATSGAIEDVVRAFDIALGTVLRDLVAWTLRAVSTARAAG